MLIRNKLNTIFLFLLLSVVKIYRTLISPLMGARCRFVPTCSHYAMDALEEHGSWRGLRLIIKRISKCHPWGGFGLDEVPVKKRESRDRI